MEQKKAVIRINFPFYPGHHPLDRKNALSHDLSLIPQYLKAVLKEMETAAEELSEYEITALHFGYGTPLLADSDLLADFLLSAKKLGIYSDSTHVSMRILPSQLSAAALTVLRNAGVNELIMETCTCRSREFAHLERPYYFSAFDGAVSLLTMYRQEGVHHELLAGIPEQTGNTIKETIDYVLKSDPSGIILKSFIENENSKELIKAASQELIDAGMTEYKPYCYAFPGKEHHYLLNEDTDLIGFGVCALTSLDGMKYRNTDNIYVYIAHSGELEAIASLIK